jgi:glycosyltransferase involved in cell wall biosynthesis
MRAYVRNDTFFQSLPLVWQSAPEVRFICPNMAGDSGAEGWVQQLGRPANLQLLPAQTRQDMAELFRSALIGISPTNHDGTPNTFLEMIACGCFPIVGDLESLREWITPGVNGLVFDPSDPQALARAVLLALENPVGLLERAAQENARLVRRRAEYRQVMREAESFYQAILG